MKAIRIHQFGTPEVLGLEELPRPEPQEGEVLVQVEAAGVGPWDAWVRAGKSVIEQPLPLTPGSDLSGHVAALGPGVNAFQIGQAVYGVTNPRFTGGYAEYALAHASMLAPKPASLNHVQAASVPVIATTALQMLFDHAQVQRGQRVLIHGAGGGVGAFALQLALAAGAEVVASDVALALDYVRSLGQVQVIDARAERFEDVIEPVDVVIDTVGKDIQDRSFAILKRGGTLISAVAPPDQTLAKSSAVNARFILVDVTSAVLTQLAALLDEGKLRTRVGPVLPLSEARSAHEMLEGVRQRPPGKIVLSVGNNADATS